MQPSLSHDPIQDSNTYLAYRFPVLHVALHSLESASSSLGAPYTINTRYLIASAACRSLNLGEDPLRSRATVWVYHNNQNVEITPTRILTWTGRSPGTFNNHRTFLLLLRRKYQILLENEVVDDGWRWLIDFHSEIQQVLLLHPLRRPKCLSWSFPVIEQQLFRMNST